MNLDLIFPREIFLALLSVINLVFIDVVAGIILSIKQGNFDWRILPRFLQQNIMPYVGGLLILALGASINQEIKVLFFTAVAATVAKFMADVKDKLVGIFGQTVQPVAKPNNSTENSG